MNAVITDISDSLIIKQVTCYKVTTYKHKVGFCLMRYNDMKSLTCNGLHDVVYRKRELFISNIFRISNLKPRNVTVKIF
jgi:hypothetical protein